LFGGFTEARLASSFDAGDKEIGRTVVLAGDPEPSAPEGGKVKVAPLSRIFPNSAFGYRTITVERPQRDDAGNIVVCQRGKAKGKPQADSALRDTENVPLSEEVESYFEREVLPHADDAWIDTDKTKVGYEIPFTRHFYVFEPPRPLAEIDADLDAVTDRIKGMLEGLAA
jgi:type I restriction enzyme M protein